MKKLQIEKVRSHWQLYAILALPIIYLLVFHYYPMYGAQLAFKRWSARDGILGSQWVGLKYFKMFFAAPSCSLIIKNTLLLSLYTILASFPLPIFLAICLNETKNKYFAKTVQMVTYAPYFISTVVMVGILFQVFEPNYGIVNKLLQFLHLPTARFMEGSEYFRGVYVWSGVWQTTGYSAIIYLAALAGVNPQLQEAAIIDGASLFKRIIHVDIPCISTTIIILLILSFGNVMSVGFEKVYLMQNDINTATSEIIATYVYKTGLINANFGFSTAVGLFQSVINFILLISVNKIASKISNSSLW